MIKLQLKRIIYFALISLTLFSSCDKKETIITVPVLSTIDVTNLIQNTGKSGGVITSDGGSSIIAKGVCWSTAPNPTIADRKTTEGAGIGTFISTMNGISPDSTYYVRAYATNVAGTAYGNIVASLLTDIDGNKYTKVTIGTQTWMVENLRTTRYRTGESISNVTDATAWSNATFGAYCDYNNDINNGATYGKLYNWAAVNDSRNITPLGWHVATHAEWTTLVNYLGGESVAAAKLKETGTIHWKISTNGGATNETGFKAFPGGLRNPSGAFGSLGENGYWWSSTENSNTPGTVWHWYMSFDNINVHKDYDIKSYGRSVRCVKD
ncbi:MAG: fibrobacter succinogenes major paralogous domain-containing protein [Paludibacter sp.]